MNLIEAIKKAQAAKVKVETKFTWHYTTRLTCVTTSVSPGLISPDYLVAIIGDISEYDLLRDNWEVEAKRVTITAKDYWKAVEEANKERESSRLFGVVFYLDELPALVAKKLGLED